MALITVNAIFINGESIGSRIGSNYTPVEFKIEDTNIKYVFQNGGFTSIIYYDQMAAKLTEVVVTETPFEVWALYDSFILITTEKLDGIPSIKAMAVNENAFGYSIALSAKDPDSLSIVTYSGLAGGTFTINDIITGDTSLATARVVSDDGVGLMVVHPINGTLSTSDVITSSDGDVTADVDTYAAAPQRYMLYQNGQSVARKKKEIICMESAGNLNYAITAASIANRTFTISGDHQARLTRDVPFFVDGSTANDGMYTVIESTVSGGNTVIRVRETVWDATADGTIIDA